MAALRAHDGHYIGGAWQAPLETAAPIEVVNPTTEEVIGSVPAGSAADVGSAVAAATTAFPGWAATPVVDRAAFLNRIGDELEKRAEELATLITSELGMPFKLAQMIQVGNPITTFRATAEIAAAMAFEEEVNNSLVVREPVGVVGAITPWNFPLHQIAAKLAPALAAGCSVVLKPSELTPLSVFAFFELLDAVGLPAGVVNLVSGYGVPVGEALALHPGVDLISFTGSSAVGRRVSELAAATTKRVALELGGKSANVVLDDADLGQAVADGVAKCFLNSGQTCSALTRLLVPRQRLGEAEEIAVAAAAKFTPGDPFERGTRLGPLVSAAQRERVRHYIETGIAEGAELLTGGPDAPEGLDTGYFVAPTIFSKVTNEMTIARDEIFGPVLVLIAHDGDDDAVRMANDSPYGLAGGVWSADPERALALARRLRTGQVDVNGARYNPIAPFGGFKQSGHGREFGAAGIEEYLETKAIQR